MALTATIGTSYHLHDGFVWADSLGLTVSIRPLQWKIGGVRGTYAGITGQAVVNGTNYVYLTYDPATPTGVLNVNVTGWPTTGQPHLRLAVVTAAAGAITNVADHRAFVTSDHVYTEYYHPGIVAESAGGAYETSYVLWQCTCGVSTTSTIVGPNTLHAVAFAIDRTIIIDRAYTNCTAIAGTTGNKKMSAFIYGALGLNHLYPGAPIGNLGEIDVAVGIKTFPVATPITLVPGFYFMVMNFDHGGTDPVFSAVNRVYLEPLLGLDSSMLSAAPVHRIYVASAYNTTPPNPFPTGGTYDGGNQYTPSIAVRLSSVDS